jgi:hypothetical protein
MPIFIAREIIYYENDVKSIEITRFFKEKSKDLFETSEKSCSKSLE